MPPHRFAWFYCCFCYWLYLSCATAATEILVLQSHDSPPYQQTLSGFQSDLEAGKLDVVYQTLTLSPPNDSETLAHTLQTGKPKLILALGTPATRLVLQQVTDIPIVASLVLDIDEIRQHPMATGVGLNFSADLQWQWLRRLLPDAREIAVLYDPKQGGVLFQRLQKLAQTEGVNLIQAAADNAENLPKLMETLPPQLDALWAVDGAAAYSASAVRELLLYSFRNRVPLVGLSAQWVKAGALYALDWDYGDLGAQTAELAKAVLLKGSAPTSLPPPSPRKVRPVLNLKTAEHMKIPIPDRWQAEMAEVFQ